MNCSESYTGEYNEPLHIASIFIILTTSALGVFLPTILRAFKGEGLDFAVALGKFFGAGVITATGFVHVFPEAVASLTDPCVGGFFEEYTAAAGLIAMLAVLLSHLIQYIAEGTYLRQKEPTYDTEKAPEAHSHGLFLAEADKRTLSTYILEVAVGIHSVIIGMDLGISDEEFITLLIALCFHQFFEGIGLGYRIAEIDYKHKAYGYLSAGTYAVTTPLGIAIGIAMRVTDSGTDSTGGLLTIGVLDSAAAGILIYSSVLFIMEEFNGRFRGMGVTRQILCFVGFYAGCGLMATLGIWA
uniref:Zinc/iron permease n=1 Tax=Arcella intermedia TaxID=1963864 RepID=A0A6B2LBJ7_9EUKA